MKLVLGFVLVALTTTSFFGNVHAQYTSQYHSELVYKTETKDITFQWRNSLLGGNWNKFKLWDDGLTTHFYVYFYYAVDVSMDIPATLTLTYPNRLEPSDPSNIKTKLEMQGSRIIKIRPQIYLGIDLDLPLPIYIPNVGLTDKIKAVYGADWTITFNLNNRDLKQLLNKVWVGDFDSQQSFTKSKKLNDYITIEKLSINSATLGELASAKIRIDLLRALLEVLTLIVSGGVTAFVKTLVQILDWMISKVFHASTGLIITPSVSAYIRIPVSGDSQNINVQTENLRFDTDLSSKTIPLTVSSNAKEETTRNQLGVNMGPVAFTFLFDANWQYYFDVDVNALGYSIYKKTWLFNLFRYPAVQWDSNYVTQSMALDLRVDEPLSATSPNVLDEKVSIELDDKSGISLATIHYSKDRNNWDTMAMANSGRTYSAAPINEVTKDTTVYYYFEVKDGDGDSYEIGSRSNYYNFLLRSPTAPIVTLPFSPQSSTSLNILTIAVIVLIVSTILAVVLIRKKHQFKKTSKPKLVFMALWHI